MAREKITAPPNPADQRQARLRGALDKAKTRTPGSNRTPAGLDNAVARGWITEQDAADIRAGWPDEQSS